jgi:VanZ family protein
LDATALNLLLFGIAAAAITVGCLVPNRWLPPLPNDKFLHFAGFAVLAALLLRIPHDRAEGAWWLLGLLVAGGVIECLQSLVPDRTFSWRDIAANAAGIGFVAVCAQLYASFA